MMGPSGAVPWQHVRPFGLGQPVRRRRPRTRPATWVLLHEWGVTVLGSVGCVMSMAHGAIRATRWRCARPMVRAGPPEMSRFHVLARWLSPNEHRRCSRRDLSRCRGPFVPAASRPARWVNDSLAFTCARESYNVRMLRTKIQQGSDRLGTGFVVTNAVPSIDGQLR